VLFPRYEMDAMTRWMACVAVAGSLNWACASKVPVVVQTEDGPTAGAAGAFAGDFIDDEGAAGRTGASAGGGSSICGAPTGDATCGGQTFAGKSVPLAMYILFDESASMCACLDAGAGQLCLESGCKTTRLDAVRQAIDKFLLDPNSEGISVGLGLFGQQEIGETSCEPSSYADPTVAVGLLPEQAGALSDALSRLTPTGETPTGPGLRGACDYARDYRARTQQRQVVLLLLTDGRPEAPSTCRGGTGVCCPSLGDAVLAAEECRTQAGISTFVLGVGPLLDNLDQIAVAGGTEGAHLVQGGDVSTEVLNALNRIRGDAAIPCELALPEPPAGQGLALDTVNLEYEGAQCEHTPFDAVRSAADCGEDDGWYYDDPAKPGSIQLCPTSCDRVSGPGGKLYYSVGCATRIR
jgi:hypothetical protein